MNKLTELLPDGATLDLGTKELEVNGLIPHEEFMSGKVFLSTDTSSTPTSLVASFSASTLKKANQAGAKKQFMNPNASSGAGSKTGLGVARAGAQGGMRRPTWAHTRMTHDPNTEDALVLLRTPFKEGNGAENEGECVVVDPLLGDILRPHQRQGVQFLFDSVTGRIDPSQLGCILADEMVRVLTFIYTGRSRARIATQHFKKTRCS
jgi:DNA repair and recombination protein RAD54B